MFLKKESTRWKGIRINEMKKINDRIETNWYVISGGPGCGKTTMVNLLRERGYHTTIEHARHFLYTQRIKGRTVEEVRKNQLEFQLGVLNMQIEQEASLSPEQIIFLDRALPDSLAYYRYLYLEPDKRLFVALEKAYYKKIFILDLLPLVNDYARRENEAAQKKIHELIIEVYTSLSFPIVHVPVLPTEDRADLILNHL
jgi:predicted ATPase